MLFQGRILDNEKHHVVQSLHDGSKVSCWPQDLMVPLESQVRVWGRGRARSALVVPNSVLTSRLLRSWQLQIALTRLQGDSVWKICVLCIGLLRFFHKELDSKMRAEGLSSMTVERLCVYANDCTRFCDRLHDQIPLLDSLTAEAAEKVTQEISAVGNLFAETCDEALGGIVSVVTSDVTAEIEACVFTGAGDDRCEIGVRSERREERIS